MIAIADDLTGAADCAAPCAARGLEATVLLHSTALHPGQSAWSQSAFPDSPFLSIDANTRALPADQAAAVAAGVVRLCQANGALGPGVLLFKKIDSTLRGNWAAELAAILCAILRASSGVVPGPRPVVILAPALPAQGRTTRGGRQAVHGRPLEETDFWDGRRSDAGIAAMLAEAALTSRLVGLGQVRAEASRLRRVMTDLARAADVLVCDAESDDDLGRIAEASVRLRRPTIWAGSAGLAWHLPLAAGIAGIEVPAPHPSPPASPPAYLPAGPTLFIVGTLAAASCRQAQVLAREPDMICLRIRAAQLLESQAEAAAIAEGLRAGRDVLVSIDETERCAADQASLLARALSRWIEPCARLAGALVATGGETARAVFDDLGIRRLRVLGEVEPGLPFCVAEGGSRAWPVLTKAGGFGSSETLVRCREFLRKREGAAARSSPVC